MNTEQHSHIDPVKLHLLVLRCQAGDEQAFFDLYHIYKEPTLRYVQGLLDTRVADDVHQEVWLTVYQKIQTLANPKAFRTWLYQTTRFRAIDYLRKQKRDDELLGCIKEETPVEFEETEEPDFDPQHARLKQALDQLPAAQRDVLILLYWEQMSYEEISLIVGCAIGTIRSRIYNAKNKLKEILEQAPSPQAKGEHHD